MYTWPTSSSSTRQRPHTPTRTQVGDQILADSGKTQLQKTMNADEAFCFGAALYAASLSTAFRLRKFGVHDITR